MWKLVISHLACFYFGFFLCAFWVGRGYHKSKEEKPAIKNEKEIARHLLEGK